MEKLIKNNKILVISHVGDPDGMGSVILASLAFKEIDYLLIETTEQKEALAFIKENNYEQIFICDIPMDNEIGDEINTLNLNIKHFDHHGTNTYVSKYSFSKVLVEDEEGKTCGTKLFYKYLKQNNLLKETPAINKFVILVNDYDTWMWKENKDIEASKLNTLFNVIGTTDFINRMVNKLGSSNEFTFNEEEKSFIKYREKEINELINACNKSLIKVKINDHLVGITFINKYQSIVGNELCIKNKDIDYAMLINMVDKKVSLRSISKDVSSIAISYGGGGHKLACGFSLTDENRNKLLKYIIEDK